MNSSGHLDTSTATIIARDNHCVSRKDISESALKVLYRLNKAGYDAYLVGGGVRDLLLSKNPKDFDVATSALPEEAAAQFKNSRLIGRRFRLLHVRFGREIIEVATFRGNHSQQSEQNDDNEDLTDCSGNQVGKGKNKEVQAALTQDGMIVRDNVYGSLTEDAWRRDFTVNALYYSVKDFSVLDYTGGIEDLNNRVLRCIGDAEQRYQEDPVRMIRAIRLSAKLDFSISPESSTPIKPLAHKLAAVPAARLFEEVLKLFMSGHAVKTFHLLREYGLFAQLFPQTDAVLDLELENSEKDDKNSPSVRRFIEQGLRNTDERIAQGKPVTPAFLYAVMLWHPVDRLMSTMFAHNDNHGQTLQIASSEVITKQIATVSLPKRYSVQVREIWAMQSKLTRRHGKRAFRLVLQARFRAGYDFLLLRAQSGESELEELGDWWTEFQLLNTTEQSVMVQKLNDNHPKKRQRKRPKKSKPSS